MCIGTDALRCYAGQFGTRLQGGKDAAGARYIMTRLDKIARVVFHEHDDKLLGYLKEEGQSIEPQWCDPALRLRYIKSCCRHAWTVVPGMGAFHNLEPEPYQAMELTICCTWNASRAH